MFAVLLLATLAANLRADEPKQYDPTRWEKEIARFEEEDARVRRPAGSIVFVGSSSIGLWNLGKSFPDHATINRGFGGSQVEDAVYFADRIVLPYQPTVKS